MELPSAPVEKRTKARIAPAESVFPGPTEGTTVESFRTENAPANDHGCGRFPSAWAFRSISRSASPAGNGISTS